MKLRLSASVFMIAAGLIHLAIAPLHWAHAPAHGLFFALSGGAEVAWGIAYWRKPTTTMQTLGVVMAGGLIALWIITRLLPAPFGDEPGEIEITGLVSKGLEGLGLAALVAIAVSGIASQSLKHAAWRTIGKVMIASFVAGWLAYWLGLAAVPLFPGLGEPAAPAVVASAGDSAREDPIGESLTAGSTARVTDDLQLVVAGFASPFSNGSEIPAAGDLLAGLTMMPGDERYSRELLVYLYHQASSKPVEDAAIQATAAMRFMDHGTFHQIAFNVGGGNYILLLPFPMPGEWRLEIEIGASDRQDTIRLDISLFD